MSKSVTVDRVKVIAEMARQNITGEELAQKAGVGRFRKCAKGKPYGALPPGTLPQLSACLWKA